MPHDAVRERALCLDLLTQTDVLLSALIVPVSGAMRAADVVASLSMNYLFIGSRPQLGVANDKSRDTDSASTVRPSSAWRQELQKLKVAFIWATLMRVVASSRQDEVSTKGLSVVFLRALNCRRVSLSPHVSL